MGFETRTQGDDISLEFSVTDDDGNVVDITGATLLCSVQLVYSATPSSPVPADQVAIDDGPGGLCHAQFSRATTKNFIVGGYYRFDGRVMLASGLLHTIGGDIFRVLAPVTPTP